MNPSIAEFVKRIQETYENINGWDTTCDAEMEMARWQTWVNSWEPILDENGGL